MEKDVTFISQLTKAQFELKVYIAALACDLQDVDDILQETNVYIWRKADTYDPSRPFLPWAKALAKYQVLRWRKDLERDRLVLDDTAIELLADDALSEVDHDVQMLALRRSLRQLTDDEFKLLKSKYVARKRMPELAREFHVSEGAVASRLFRIRKYLHTSISEMLKMLRRQDGEQ
ncbi:MAG: sigma-70 family RNA polymerase sigma factor [Kiritimatiellae bacterium]|nr:sigma-70 family RNA polymerase sigma factor [Kiritimatiellia bacterium]